MYESETTFFTADPHLNHQNALMWRPQFRDTQEMLYTIIENHNRVVPPGGTTFVLGDAGLSKKSNAHIATYCQLTNGQKHFIRGNHDDELKDSQLLDFGFSSVSDLKRICVKDPTGNTQRKSDAYQDIVLCHYAMRSWQKSHHNAWHLHGHHHNAIPPMGKSIDVGVDGWNFTPVSYQQVKDRIKSYTYFKRVGFALSYLWYVIKQYK